MSAQPIYSLRRMVLLDALTTNWAAIADLAGRQSTAELTLAAFISRLESATENSHLDAVLLELLEFAEETAAADFVADLLDRAALLDLDGTGQRGEASEETTFDLALELEALRAQSELVSTAGEKVDALPVDVFFGTNRRLDESESEGGPLQVGIARAVIPVKASELGRAEVPSRVTFNKDDPTRFITIDSVAYGLDEAAFRSRLADHVIARQSQDLMVFVHGYNVRFDEAARAAAQLAFNVAFPGTVILFSWPSQGKLRSYAADEERAAAAGPRLNTFLQLLEGGPWNRVHLVAHSMGNRVLMGALTLAGEPVNASLSQLAMVAADVSVESFENHHPIMAGLGATHTLYASRRDRALMVSRFLHKIDRVGHTRDDDVPFTIAGVETIDASTVHTGMLGHGYHAEKRAMMTDLETLVTSGAPADARSGIRRANGPWWTFAN